MKKRFKLIFASILLIGILATVSTYFIFFHVAFVRDKAIVVKAYPGDNLSGVFDTISNQHHLPYIKFAKLLAKLKSTELKIGYYRFEKGTTINAFLNRLNSGFETPVSITIPKFRKDFEFIAKKLSDRLLIDSTELIEAYHDTSFWNAQHIALEQRQAFFIRNTYEVYWTVSGNELMRRMISEFHKYFKQKQQFPEPLTSPVEVAILASIINEETTQPKDQDTVASLYLNRLQKGMRLEADPTVRFANGDFSVRRILTKDLGVKSPYNTYKVSGLPVGPICNPSPSAIEAVLKNVSSPYIFMCASLENPGYHKFSRTLREHNNYSRRYRRELNRRRIYR